MRRTMMLVALTLATPLAASAQAGGNATATARASANAAVHGTGDAAADARIRAAIEHAASVGVPEWLLERKVAEGEAKGVAAEKIAAAVEHRATVLARVQSALDARVRGTTDGELTAAADAHERGVSLDALARVSAGAGNDRAAALTVLADLVEAGKVPEHALLRVETALSRGGSALAELRANAAASARANIPSVRIRGDATVRGERPAVRATSRVNVRTGG
ncbi:MAG TPA: hypothetical protein VK928_12030 [Longimicrobiales bacterium]|nr:hypothetical protein [Longimicrobiales bacterium]